MLIVESKDRQCIVDFVKALVWEPDVLGLTLPGFTLSVSVWFVGYYLLHNSVWFQLSLSL